ncbi:MAG TPA: LssY C-terminal domain-containing protein [Stenomitos sp.]
MDISDLNPLPTVKQGMRAVGHLKQEVVAEVKQDVDRLLPDRFDSVPQMPAYTPLPLAEKVAAEQRSVGKTYPQRPITNEAGQPHEPVNLVLTGTKAEIVNALERTGWSQADNVDTLSGLKTAYTMLNKITPVHKVFDYDYESSPVSDMFLDGKRYAMAFNKNNQHNMARDHLRVFDTGKTDAQGRPVWEVAATRDTGIHIDFKDRKGNHETDHHVDPERDMVMADLLASGEVGDWHIAKGERSPEDDRSLSTNYQTDGKVYLVDLTARPELKDDHLLQQPSKVREVVRRLPEPIRDTLHAVDRKLTDLMHSWM